MERLKISYGIMLVTHVLFTCITYAQKQNNTIGSEVFVDVPHYIFNKYLPLPVSVYIHESECNNCQNYLNYIDIRFKCAKDTQWSPVYVYSNWTYNQFLNLFNCYSVEDTLWGVQSFLSSMPFNSSEHTILFTADTNYWFPPVPIVEVNKRYFYFNFNIPPNLWNMFLCEDSVLDLHVYVSLDYAPDEEFYFRIFVSHNGLPTINKWYRGDVHVHSYYTQNIVENGFPLCQTKIAAKYNGLSWITLTDHSCDFDNYGLNPIYNYERLKAEIQFFNNNDSSFKFIPAIEASVLNSKGKTIHALIYPNESNIYSFPYFFDAKGDNELTEINLFMLYDSLEKYNAFCYAAHPFAQGDKLSDFVYGDVWNIGDIDFKLNGELHSYAGNVICNDINYASDVFSGTDTTVFFKPLYGFQLWNLWYTLTCNDTYNNPWNTNHLPEPYGFVPVEDFNYLHHYYKLQQNLEVYNFLLRKSLKFKNQNLSVKYWKPYLIGGSDAHGSFNFSTTDYVNLGISGYVENNFIGAINTVAFCPEGLGLNGENVLKALKNGKTIISSGPLLIPFLNYNSNYYTCGDTVEVFLSNVSSAKIFLTSKTSKLFGNVESCKMFIITENEVYVKDLNLLNQTTIFYLNNLLDTLVHSNLQKYIAFYFILTTKKNYDKPHIYKKSYEYFYSITNPIWVKIKNDLNITSNKSDFFNVFYDNENNTIYLQTENFIKAEIIDVTGKTLCSYFNVTEISCKELPTGIYFLRIISERKIATIKFLKMK
ncbi:MAG: T9SS type A sorting domain-containing protein [Bacteroidales bacterium]|nr:T9SS type A sorting domain-containing protein [Bacteroidales bacterium]